MRTIEDQARERATEILSDEGYERGHDGTMAVWDSERRGKEGSYWDCHWFLVQCLVHDHNYNHDEEMWRAGDEWPAEVDE